MELRRIQAVALLLFGIASVAAHGSESMDMDMSMGASHSMTVPSNTSTGKAYDLWDEPSYARLDSHNGMILAHIICMVMAWFFVLPVGVMFSVARSHFTIPVQLVFLLLNGLGVVSGTVYNMNTPDLYANNAHHKIGWIATWVFTAQVIMSVLFLFSGRSKTEVQATSERAAFLPTSLHAAMPRSLHRYRWSGDTQAGDMASPSGSARSSRTLSPNRDYIYDKTQQDDFEDVEDAAVPFVAPETPRRPSWLQNTKLDKFFATRVPKVASQKVVRGVEVAYEIIDRTILILGFIALTTGIVTYAGLFRANNVFNGLAHWIKGGIFFWYGLLTLGRWCGSFADFGWAWNLKPTQSEVGWKSKIPTAEFTESFVIFLYGCTNVFLEHLAAAGDVWSAQDLEHVSISVMFFGGGLAGMLVESKTLRKWLNTSIDQMPTRAEVHPAEAREVREEPKNYTASLNIMPALIILLLGIMMSSHHQDSMLSTMVHKQWGTLLSCFSLCRGFTYLLNYLSPPKSIYPSRPPTELAAAFCLMSGGLVFMLSTKDVIHAMERSNLMAMFVFTVVMGFTAFLMAYTMLVIGLKGWAVRRERRTVAKQSR